MAHHNDGHALILPKPDTVSLGIGIADATDRATIIACYNQSTPVSRRPKAVTRPDEVWQENRESIQKLYLEDDLPLGMVINIIRAEHGFQAT